MKCLPTENSEVIDQKTDNIWIMRDGEQVYFAKVYVEPKKKREETFLKDGTSFVYMAPDPVKEGEIYEFIRKNMGGGGFVQLEKWCTGMTRDDVVATVGSAPQHNAKYGIIYTRCHEDGFLMHMGDFVRCGKFNRDMKLSFIRKLAEIIWNLHRNGISHNDMHWENVLVNKNGPMLFDWGHSGTQWDGNFHPVLDWLSFWCHVRDYFPTASSDKFASCIMKPGSSRKILDKVCQHDYTTLAYIDYHEHFLPDCTSLDTVLLAIPVE